VLIFGSAVLAAFVDNIPYTAAMAPIVDDVVSAAPDPALDRPLW
jgi:Na+/H+ antiporter NhaD/arsenite permease-like protein